ncbi:hypothetical protein BJF83_21385 [Nocardiopsis sp. CNR-923]|uniref:hypothetical protein n=1 Tax=Nocardiopsis sp. CNR-923 TaxID=1904965 RepID=UPI00096543FC|nr:hypothetical protein [Nocardiopsis sp. CNR-923]OLT26356.1 hypothetical protein BJF83_21385 [Nocardiopsis sp. CNR-923]
MIARVRGLASGPPPRGVVSLGLGVDSSALVAAWAFGALPLPWDWEDMAVLIAQTGDEWPITKQLVEEHLFPLLAERRVRTIQVARAGPVQADGVTVFSDTRAPTVCHIEGDYTLADELLAAGTVPQAGGARRCSQKAKGFPLDQTIARITAGRPYEHVVGFEVEEQGRADRDRGYGPARRVARYPLIEHGWTRQMCSNYLLAEFGTPWAKSCCTYCPYALTSRAGRARTLPRYVADPAQAMLPLLMECTAVALNPRQGLIAGERLHDALARHPGGERVLDRFAAHLEAQTWAVYHVRRVWQRASAGPEHPGSVTRDLQVVARGSRGEMHAELARANGARAAEDGVERVWAHQRTWNDSHPAREELWVAAPATASPKRGPAFAEAWARAEMMENQTSLI